MSLPKFIVLRCDLGHGGRGYGYGLAIAEGGAVGVDARAEGLSAWGFICRHGTSHIIYCAKFFTHAYLCPLTLHPL